MITIILKLDHRKALEIYFWVELFFLINIKLLLLQKCQLKILPNFVIQQTELTEFGPHMLPHQAQGRAYRSLKKVITHQSDQKLSHRWANFCYTFQNSNAIAHGLAYVDQILLYFQYIQQTHCKVSENTGFAANYHFKLAM